MLIKPHVPRVIKKKLFLVHFLIKEIKFKRRQTNKKQHSSSGCKCCVHKHWHRDNRNRNRNCRSSCCSKASTRQRNHRGNLASSNQVCSKDSSTRSFWRMGSILSNTGKTGRRSVKQLLKETLKLTL